MNIENKITVCTVSLNSGGTLRSTIESVREQSELGIVHIIKDGVSDDNTAEIASRYTNVKFISKPDIGIYDAMNQVLEEVDTEFIHFLNSDDCYASADTLENVLEKMEQENLDVLFCGVMLVDQSDKVVRYWDMSHSNFLQRMGVVQAPHPGIFLRTKVFERLKYRFSTNYKISSDYELQYLIANSCDLRTARSDIIAVRMRVGGQSTGSANAVFKGLLECVDILKKNKVAFARSRVALKFMSKIFQLFKKER